MFYKLIFISSTIMNTVKLDKNEQKPQTGLVKKIALTTLGIGCIAAVGLVEGYTRKEYPKDIYNANDGILLKQERTEPRMSGIVYVRDDSSKFGYKAFDLSTLDTNRFVLNYGEEPKKNS